MKRKEIRFHLWYPELRWPAVKIQRVLLPTPGNVLFTLLIVAGLLWAQSAGALPVRSTPQATRSTGTIAYQGRLADADGNPLTGTMLEQGSGGARERG